MQWGLWVLLPSWSVFFLKSWVPQLKSKVSLNCSLFNNSVSVPCPVIIFLLLSPKKPAVVLHGQSLPNNDRSVVKVVQKREEQRAWLPETQTKGHLLSDGFAIAQTFERINYYSLFYASLSMVVKMFKTKVKSHLQSAWNCPNSIQKPSDSASAL